MADEKFEGLLKQNLSPAQAQEVEALWHRYALAALQGITRTIDHGETDAGTVAELAGDYADEMLLQWDMRFNPVTCLNDDEEEEPPENETERAPGARRGHEGRGREGHRGGRRS